MIFIHTSNPLPHTTYTLFLKRKYLVKNILLFKNLKIIDTARKTLFYISSLNKIIRIRFLSLFIQGKNNMTS